MEQETKLEIPMGLRDYFAAAVITGQISKFGCTSDAEYDAKKAYLVADAMMKERAKPIE